MKEYLICPATSDANSNTQLLQNSLCSFREESHGQT